MVADLLVILEGGHSADETNLLMNLEACGGARCYGAMMCPSSRSNVGFLSSSFKCRSLQLLE